MTIYMIGYKGIKYFYEKNTYYICCTHRFSPLRVSEYWYFCNGNTQTITYKPNQYQQTVDEKIYERYANCCEACRKSQENPGKRMSNEGTKKYYPQMNNTGE